MPRPNCLVLFGATAPWSASDWTSSDDRVRGGISQSYLTISPSTPSSHSTARFHGTLDIKTLGGAGFASQRTVGEDRIWDVSAYDGILLELGETDGKKYTFTIKDELLGLDEGGREMSSVSWEYDFTDPGTSSEGLYIPWSMLNATYRGRPKDDAEPLKLDQVKRWSIMNRSFFGEQEGDFSLTIKSIKAVKQSGDAEKGIVARGNGKEAWSWKNSNLVGLGVILSATWALCFSFCWWKGINTSHMTLSRWWRVTGRKGFGAV
ncbi:complex I intermediate-associated protein 30-domain-containing protein [Paraphoma chrysanthemicola]|uniref:Complex I intermediate-associated protein 30-domain-containing protein n=1 Tax=Paraphoma chrysanthemicola TaxID=798071 RepID=A0A8K0RJT1_9PLEO|nr:complex I intermediate-associated protein 30-domain-containing protein [Paraphoma chrysanthemicola]